MYFPYAVPCSLTGSGPADAEKIPGGQPGGPKPLLRSFPVNHFAHAVIATAADRQRVDRDHPLKSLAHTVMAELMHNMAVKTFKFMVPPVRYPGDRAPSFSWRFSASMRAFLPGTAESRSVIFRFLLSSYYSTFFLKETQ